MARSHVGVIPVAEDGDRHARVDPRDLGHVDSAARAVLAAEHVGARGDSGQAEASRRVRAERRPGAGSTGSRAR